MRVFHELFAIVAGAAVTGAAAFSGRVAHQFRKIFLDFGAELPALTRSIVEAPFALYVAVGVILGALAAWPIWVAKSKVDAVLIAVRIAFAVVAWWLGFAVAVLPAQGFDFP